MNSYDNPWYEESSKSNPWIGASAYEYEQKDSFYGRKEESIEIKKLIEENICVTLYGRSGIGKTSLINAGVLPLLEDYIAIRIRLNVNAEMVSYQQCICDTIVNVLKGKCYIDNVYVASKQESVSYLYEWFKKTSRLVKNKHIVIILDQFEEILRLPPKPKGTADVEKKHTDDAELLLRQIYQIVRNTYFDNNDINCHFLLSIREDDLYLLEDCIDENYLYDLKQCRYRLRSLTLDGAREVVTIPGKDIFNEGEINDIANKIVDEVKKESGGEINSLILSLLCSRIYDENFSQYLEKDEKIPLKAVEKIEANEILDKYFEETTNRLNNDEKVLLDDFIDDYNRRVSIPYTKKDNNIIKDEHTDSGNKYISLFNKLDKKLLQQNGNNIELIHDSFCSVLAKAKELRMQEKKRKERNRKLFFLVIFFVLFLCWFFILLYQNEQLNITNSILKENRARFLSEKGMTLIDDGDFYSAQMLALEILPKDLSHPDRPFVPEAEGLMRFSCGIDNVLLQDLPGFVNKAIYSPNGELIVAAFDNPYIVKFWDAKTGAEMNELQHSGPVSSISYSADGRLLITSTKSNATISIWDARQKKLISTIHGEENDCFNDVAISPDGELIAAALGNYKLEHYGISYGFDSERVVKVWKRDSGELIWKSPHFYSSVSSVSFSPDGRLLAGVGICNVIRVWDVPSFNLRYTLNNVFPETSVAFSPNGEYLGFGNHDEIMLVSPRTGKTVKVLKNSDYYWGKITDIAFSQDSRYVGSLTTTGDAFVWNINHDSIEHDKKVHGSGRFGSVAWNPKEKTILTTSVDDKTIRSWQFGRSSDYTTIENGIFFISYSQKGDSIYGIKSNFSSSSDIFVVCDAKNFAIKDSCLLRSNFSYTINSTVFNVEKRIALRWSEKEFDVWSLSSGNIIKTFSDTSFINGAALHPIKDRIATVCYNLPIIKEWRINSGKPVRLLERAYGSLSNLVYSPDGHFIAAFSDDWHIYIWDEKTGSLVKTLRADCPFVNSLKFSPDNRFLMATSNSGSTIWRTKDWKRLHNLRMTLDDVEDANFSSDSKYIVQSFRYGVNYYLHIWNTEAGCRVCTYDTGERGVYNAVFSPDGRKILTQGYNEKIIIRDFPALQELINKSVERFKNRKLTEKERKKYYLD